MQDLCQAHARAMPQNTMQELCQFSAVNKNCCGTPFADAKTMPEMSMQESCQLLWLGCAQNPWHSTLILPRQAQPSQAQK